MTATGPEASESIPYGIVTPSMSVLVNGVLTRQINPLLQSSLVFPELHTTVMCLVRHSRSACDEYYGDFFEITVAVRHSPIVLLLPSTVLACDRVSFTAHLSFSCTFRARIARHSVVRPREQ